MVIEKPIFIVGSGRSGTTVLYNFLSTHPELCWFSNYSDRFSHIGPLPFLHRLLDLPFIGSIGKKGILLDNRLYIRPSEAGRIYHDYCGFEQAIKTTENDLNPKAEAKIKGLIKRHLFLSGKKRFLNKQTSNNQRIRIINKMFSDAYYIHIIRDGRAVASSMLNVSWWNDTDIWWLKGKPSDWEQEGKSSIELCGLHWKRDVEEILENKYLFENRYLELKYENFIADVRSTMETITNFCKLEYSESFYDLLPQKLPNMNYKWQNSLSNQQKSILDKTLKPFLTQLGYN